MKGKNSDRDDTENHVSIKSIDGAGDVTEYTEVALDEDDLRTEEDGSGSGRVWIEYDGSTIKVYLNSDGDTKPAAPITSHLGFDLSSFFAASTTTYVGFTAGMWAAGDYHDVLDWTFWEAC